MFESLSESIESAVDDAGLLARLRGKVERAPLIESERESLLGLIDRYEADLALDAEAAETTAVLEEEGLGDAGA